MLLAVSLRRGFDFGVPLANTKTSAAKLCYALPQAYERLTAKDSSRQKRKKVYTEARKDYWQYRPEVFDIADDTDLVGYFQAWKYLEPIKPRLREEFTAKQHYVNRAKNALEKLRTQAKGLPVVFLHVRRGDALQNVLLVQPTPGYYQRAVRHFPEGSLFVILTDDWNWCQGNLPKVVPNMVRSPFQDKFDDMQLMHLTDGGIICSSSFSWWGAWLGDDKRTIVCPKRWCPPPLPQDEYTLPYWIKE